MTDWNDRIIEEFRANDGTVETAGFGRNLVLVHHIGARSGAAYTTPLMAIEQDGTRHIIASAAGAPKDPAWAHNLRAHPEVAIEAPTDDGVETVDVTAVELEGDAWTSAWQGFTRRSPAFEQYAARAQGRRFPIFRLTPR